MAARKGGPRQRGPAVPINDVDALTLSVRLAEQTADEDRRAVLGELEALERRLRAPSLQRQAYAKGKRDVDGELADVLRAARLGVEKGTLRQLAHVARRHLSAAGRLPLGPAQATKRAAALCKAVAECLDRLADFGDDATIGDPAWTDAVMLVMAAAVPLGAPHGDPDRIRPAMQAAARRHQPAPSASPREVQRAVEAVVKAGLRAAGLTAKQAQKLYES